MKECEQSYVSTQSESKEKNSVTKKYEKGGQELCGKADLRRSYAREGNHEKETVEGSREKLTVGDQDHQRFDTG